jgi:hypothetical protein
MKGPALLLFFMILTMISYGQKKGYGMIGFDVGFPQNTSTSVHTGFGVSAGYERQIHSRLTWLVQTGYLHFKVDNAGNFSNNYLYAFVPIVLGLKYYPVESFKGFYIEADAGTTVVYEDVPFIPTQTMERFTFAPAIGYHFKDVELSFRANLVQNYPYLGLRLAGKF